MTLAAVYRIAPERSPSVLQTVNGHFWAVCRRGQDARSDCAVFYTCLWCKTETVDLVWRDRRPRWHRLPFVIPECSGDPRR